MTAGIGKASKIRHIVRIRQMLRRWRQKAAASRRCVPSDVPAGHVAVSVGTSGRRFVVRATLLNHPVFKSLLVAAEEEFGFVNNGGPLAIPCDEVVFEEIILFLGRSEFSSKFADLDDFRRYCHAGVPGGFGESRPLLPQKSVS